MRFYTTFLVGFFQLMTSSKKNKENEKNPKAPNERSRCCQSGCDDCPFDFALSHDDQVPLELALDKNSSEEEHEIYDGEIPENEA